MALCNLYDAPPPSPSLPKKTPLSYVNMRQEHMYFSLSTQIFFNGMTVSHTIVVLYFRSTSLLCHIIFICTLKLYHGKKKP